MKGARQEKILEIIEKYDISTQEELIAKLLEAGIFATQTTISRDIRQLNLVKGVSQNGTYKYIAPKTRKNEAGGVVKNAITDSVVSVESAQNLVVVKTTPGMANAVAVGIDSLDHPHVVGSVAGDDTLLLVMKDSEASLVVERILKKAFEL
ncbi:MAG: arginine repressor [Clostridia bacterium]|nr:arginine repressor [Clostridia bacterium]